MLLAPGPVSSAAGWLLEVPHAFHSRALPVQNRGHSRAEPLWTLDRFPQGHSPLFPRSLGRETIVVMFHGGDHTGEWELRDCPELFTSATAPKRGITRHRLFHTSAYPTIVKGVRADASTTIARPTPGWADEEWTDTAQRLRAILLKFPQVAAGHVTAARLYGWPLPWHQPQLPTHVFSADGNARIRVQGIRFHRTTLFTSRLFFDLPVLEPADAFISLGADLDVDDLVRVGDAAVGNWHGPPLITLEKLTAAVVGTRRIRSRGRLLTALDLVRPTVDSPRETDLRLWLRSVGLPEPTVHPQIFCAELSRVVEPDLGYEHARLALEYDGDHHRTSKGQWNSDIARDEAMRQEGWTVLRVTGRTDYRLLEAKIRRHLGLVQTPRDGTRPPGDWTNGR